MQTIAQNSVSPHRWLAVSAPEENEFLVKDSEVRTGKPGRLFIFASAVGLTEQAQRRTKGFKVEPLDGQRRSLNVRHWLPWEFLNHSVVEHLQAGQLFTAAVCRPHP